jgi:hypothetical protein
VAASCGRTANRPEGAAMSILVIILIVIVVIVVLGFLRRGR